MPTTQTAPVVTTFAACALVQTITQTIRCHTWDVATASHVDMDEKVETREIGRIEFLPMGEWVLVCIRRTPGLSNGGASWNAYSRDEARQIYKSHVAGTGWLRGVWTMAAAETQVVGTQEMAACRETYSYGEVAYMYTEVDFPAITCPVIEERGKRHALRLFAFTTPPTPGDRYSHNRRAVKFTEIAATC